MTTTTTQPTPVDLSHIDPDIAVRLTDESLAAVGLSVLNDATKIDLIAAFNEELELRVGHSMLVRMTSDQLEEIEELIDAEDESGARQWFEHHGIDARLIAERHYETLLEELAMRAERILDVIGTSYERPNGT